MKQLNKTITQIKHICIYKQIHIDTTNEASINDNNDKNTNDDSNN